MKQLIDIINESKQHLFRIKSHLKKQNDYIDLDLPSGTLWCNHNIGADKPEDAGLLFQFGRVDGYKYGDNNHKFLSNNDDYTTTSGTEYNRADILKPKDDTAYQATNGTYRMPTKEEIDELIKNTDNKWTKLNGVKGRKFISKKDKSKWIFIPAAGYFDCDYGEFSGAGVWCYIWSASVDYNYADYADMISFNSKYCNWGELRRNYGFSIRGVCK